MSSRNKKCPKCGKKNKACQCKKSSWKIICVMAIIFFSVCSLIWLLKTNDQPHHPADQIANAKKRFNQAIESLPDKEVQAHLLALTQKDGFIMYKIFNVPNPIMYNAAKHILGVNAGSSWWHTNQTETIWGSLVHENQHILQAENSRVSPVVIQTRLQKSEYIWNCEIDAMMAETTFAQRQGFFVQNYSEFAQVMSKENMDLRTAILVIAYPNLMNQKIYRPYWPYFPEIYNSQLPPQYRDKYGAYAVN